MNFNALTPELLVAFEALVGPAHVLTALRAEATAAGLPVRLIPSTALPADHAGQLARLTIIKKPWF